MEAQIWGNLEEEKVRPELSFKVRVVFRCVKMELAQQERWAVSV